MAIVDPRLPRPRQSQNTPTESDFSRLLRRLDELLRTLLRKKDLYEGSITIPHASFTATETLTFDADTVALQGFYHGGGMGVDYSSATGNVSLSGRVVTASRVGGSGDLTITYVALTL